MISLSVLLVVLASVCAMGAEWSRYPIRMLGLAVTLLCVVLLLATMK